jgi:hypothetical protein
VDARIAQERDMLYVAQSSASEIEVYWTGAVKLREKEVWISVRL